MSIEPLDDEALLSKEVAGSWAIADVLTNITSWESELVTGLMKLDQKKQPEKLLAALADPDVYDQAHYDALQDRDLDQIFEDLQQVRIQLEDWLSEFSEQDLANPKRYRSLKWPIAAQHYCRSDFSTRGEILASDRVFQPGVAQRGG